MGRFSLAACLLTLGFPIAIFGATLPESGENFRFAIDQVRGNLGQEVELSVRNASEPPKPGVGKGTAIGEFSFVISYDTTQLELLRARRGEVLIEQGWERLIFAQSIACEGGTCRPLGRLSIRGTAETNYKEGHSALTRQSVGEWLVLKFRVKDDQHLSGQVLPVSWFWYGCTDNTLTNYPGNRMWFVDSLIDWDGQPIDFGKAFPQYFYKCDTIAFTDGKLHAKAGITFVNGGIEVPANKKFRLVIDTLRAFQGTDVEVGIRNVNDADDPSLANGKSVGGYSFQFSYDCACLQFLSARKGALLMNQGWEFFTYRYGALGNCGSGCTFCLIRVVAIADVNNGSAHPNLTQQNQGEWAVLKFRISSDRRLAGQLCQVNWFWFDCNDNTVSDSTGKRLWVVDSLYSSLGAPIDLATAFPTNVSACTTSVRPPKSQPKKFITFVNGGVRLPTPELPNPRGDLNLDGHSNQISDFNLFKDYFVFGDVVLSPDSVLRQAQIANSDVNWDGKVLQVSDLVMMARIVGGDANPLPKSELPPAEFQFIQQGGNLIVSTSSSSELGGAFLHLTFSGTPGIPTKLDSAMGLDLASNISGNELRVLLVAAQKGARIPTGTNTILSIPFTGTVQPLEVEASTYYGRELPTMISIPTHVETGQSPLPKSFSLSQNYPNPFNPSTSFTLSMPKAGRYSVRIYNVAGQVVKTFEGEAPAGKQTFTWNGTDERGRPVSSGIYFCKAQAGKSLSVKRMILTK